MPMGYNFSQYRYDSGETPPIQLQSELVYRIVSRQPVDIYCQDFRLNRVSDEVFKVRRDIRVNIKPSLSTFANFAEYITLIGRTPDILTPELGFNKKSILYYADTWAGASASFLIPASSFLAFADSDVKTIMIDEIIAHRLQSGSTKLFSEVEGIGKVEIYDLVGSLIGTVINPMKESILDGAKVITRLVPPVFHWKANTIRESIVCPCGDMLFRSGGALGAANDVQVTVKFRAC